MKPKLVTWLLAHAWAFAGVVSVVILLVVRHDYQTTAAWKAGATLLLERRADRALELVATAFTRDLRAAQTALDGSIVSVGRSPGAIHDFRYEAASLFARFPYIDALFVWNAPDPTSLVLLIRGDRPPVWLTDASPRSAFPVNLVERARVPSALVEKIANAAKGRGTAAFETGIDSTQAQVVARYVFDEELRRAPAAAYGFIVDLAWVRRHYLPDLAAQVTAMLGTVDGLSVRLVDEEGHALASLGPEAMAGSVRTRQISLLFADPTVVLGSAPLSRPFGHFAVEVGLAPDPGTDVAARSAYRAMVLNALAAIALSVGFLMMAVAARKEAHLAELRSAFVSTVTHNLKTPIASIRVLGDALARQRTTSTRSDVGGYGVMLVEQAAQLGRLVDNLLGYSRIADTTEMYAFRAVPLDEVVERALGDFRHRLDSDAFEVSLDIPEQTPEIRADAGALRLAIENLIDNAIRYSGARRSLRITAAVESAQVALSIADEGDGIPEDELAYLGQKFFRGKQARSDGSGIGLALTMRIIRDHGGTVRFDSRPGVGTTVIVALPIA